jgi:uncharacterized lipoprotein YddW (UPF0748 family)
MVKGQTADEENKSAVVSALPKKTFIIGVDYNNDVFTLNRRGELGDTPVIKALLDDVKSAGADAVCWRVSACGFVTYPSSVHNTYYPKTIVTRVRTWDVIFKRCDPLRVAVDYAHDIGLKFYVYITLFDDAYEDQEAMFGREHPEFYMRHYGGLDPYKDPLKQCIKGIFSYGYPEVRQWRMKLIRELISYGPDAVYMDCARTHAGIHPIPVHGWYPGATFPHLRYGYNDYEIERYRKRYGKEPPVRSPRSMEPLEPTEDEINWNKVRGSFLTDFMRQASREIHDADIQVCVCFYPKTYNGLNPGYHCRQQLGWFDIDWRRWVDEKLIDEIRLNIDHRKFGYDDWVAHSAQTYRYAQDKGVKVFIDCGIESKYDRMENPPAKLPITKKDQPDLFFQLMHDMTLKMLNTSADGIFYYEHCGNDQRTWNTLKSAWAQYRGQQ